MKVWLLLLHVNIDNDICNIGKDIIRSYTPVTSDMELGYVDFVVKVYFKDTNPNFPAGGKMTQHLNSLKVGDGLLMKGPKGKGNTNT